MRRTVTVCLLTLGLTLTGPGSALAWDAQFERRWTQPLGDPVTGRVVKVQDADSLWVRIGDSNVNVRLIGVSAPDVGECYYEQSKEYTTRSLIGRTVTLRTDARHDQAEARRHTDDEQHQRRFAYVYLNGRSFNTLILREGFARERDYGPSYHLRDSLLRAEQASESRNDGVWGSCYL